ncbi:hypothetical protein E7T06_08665 [Deinococcus sp. Arct2-2]|uniref:hypothetical protein n=1 Tax=Deinococcus sp. Arct2-2 TaxID=2568653 RepID=UPI0010A36CC5|nr:hypothetical protein [Deinococcus sp. Arct2-2]THF70115.1 hypothetical protein E7T06_08665 [Deinococcus sp. Arct2-2]
MPKIRAAFLLTLVLISGVAAAAPPLALSTQNGVTTLSGKAVGWKLGARSLAFSNFSTPASELTRGKIDDGGTFQIALPSAAQLKPLTRNVGDMYDVVGCDDQPSDFDIGRRDADLYWLPRLSVLKAQPSPKAPAPKLPYESGDVYNLTTTGKDELRLLYSTDYTTIRVDISCTAWGDDKSVYYNLNVAPGWNMVLDRVGSETFIEDAPESLETRWLYGVR